MRKKRERERSRKGDIFDNMERGKEKRKFSSHPNQDSSSKSLSQTSPQNQRKESEWITEECIYELFCCHRRLFYSPSFFCSPSALSFLLPPEPLDPVCI